MPRSSGDGEGRLRLLGSVAVISKRLPMRAEIINENRVLPRPSNVSSLTLLSPSEFSVIVDE